MKKVLVTIPENLLKEIDELVRSGHYSSRSEFLREGARFLLRLQSGEITEGIEEVEEPKPIKQNKDINHWSYG
ncbi:MAG: type II toxin-antitoxin system ParD family antitoxin [Candidatus Diapherotrites archaeon]|nr:type II toxin-antitoxin system ParD family antitoxin [Candidatus Diapherotrites archaeon]